MKKIIIDVDTGIDDALALALATRSKELDILGVSTVAGNVPVDLASLNSLRLLKLLGREDIQLYEGHEKPLERGIKFRDTVHGEGGLGGQLLSMKTRSKSKTHAVDYIIEMIKKHPGDISLIMLGPLTNLAGAIRKDSSIIEKIKRVYIMGGAVGVPGNISPVAEFNFYTDPESAYEVLHSGLRINLIGLNITEKTRFTEDDLKDMDPKNSYGKFIKNISELYMEKTSLMRGPGNTSLHDPVVLAACIDEEIIQYERVFVDVEYSSRISDGQSIGYFGRRAYVPNVNLGIAIDRERFKTLFIDRVLS